MWRRAWRCPCAGPIDEKDAAECPEVDAFKTVMETITGSAPPVCPWRAFEDPIVIDVFDAHEGTKLSLGPLAFGSDDPPHYLIQGVKAVEGVTNAADHERWRRQREAARLRAEQSKNQR